jgi:TniQ
MSKQNNFYSRPGLRWWVPPPAADESLESVLERTYHAYKGIRLARAGWFADVCSPPGEERRPLRSADIVRLAHLLSISPDRLHRTRVADTPDVLAPAARRAFCRECWMADDAAARPRYFRRAWAGTFTLRCAIHDEPLGWASLPALSIARIPLTSFASRPTGNAAAVLRLIEHFAQALQASLVDNAAWPTGWRLPALSARTLVARCLINLLREPAPTPVQALWPGPGLQVLCAPGRGLPPTCRRSPWEEVRSAGPPSWRRAALWTAARFVIPDLPVALWPDGMGMSTFQRDRDFVVREPTGSEGRRLRRLRAAFEREMEHWVAEMPGGHRGR